MAELFTGRITIMPLGLEAIPDVRHRLDEVVKEAQLIPQRGDVLIDGIFCYWVACGADRVRDPASRERDIRSAGQEEQDSELDDAQMDDFTSECEAIGRRPFWHVLVGLSSALGFDKKTPDIGEGQMARLRGSVVARRFLRVHNLKIP